MATASFTGNHITLLECGKDFFPALVEAIESAREEIHLETYIFADDRTGRTIAAALARAAERQVAVRVLVDGFGAREFENGLGRELFSRGAQVMTYRRDMSRLPGWTHLARWPLRRSRLRRLHRKLAVIDGRVAFVGGINILDDYDDGDNDPDDALLDAPRFDYALRIEGPLVSAIHATMRHVWRVVRWSRLRHRPPAPAPLTPHPLANGPIQAMLLVRDNFRHRRDIENAYLEAIASAQSEVFIACAYFLPGKRLRLALCGAAKRGVRVNLLLQGVVEYPLQHFATQSLYADLLKGGIRIHEYHRSQLHAKVAVIDEDWATVGSSNIDPFSLLLAREANVAIRDRGFARRLRWSLEAAMQQGAREIQFGDMHRQSLLAALGGKLAYAAVRILLELTGYGRRFDT